ncbi:hypothetical protein [Sphingomonas sp.]|uniref:hypothetical protein n=1 Tax=Sphingomonas sp. TaxID=28214 RepID=UPI0037537362
MRRMTAMIAGLVLLGGCGPSAPAPEPVRKEIRVRGEAQNQLAAASEMDRSIGLKRAIYDTGSVCKRLIGSKFVTEYKNLSMWQARCDDGKEWAIFVAPEGSTQVRPCADLKELKLPECGVIENSAPDKKTAGTKPAA